MLPCGSFLFSVWEAYVYLRGAGRPRNRRHRRDGPFRCSRRPPNPRDGHTSKLVLLEAKYRLHTVLFKSFTALVMSKLASSIREHAHTPPCISAEVPFKSAAGARVMRERPARAAAKTWAHRKGLLEITTLTALMSQTSKKAFLANSGRIKAARCI